MTTHDIDTYFATRRTVRAYDPTREIDPSLIRSLIAKAAHAPNTGNMQLYSAILTTVPDEISALAPAHFSQSAITGAKAVLTFASTSEDTTHGVNCREHSRASTTSRAIPGP